MVNFSCLSFCAGNRHLHSFPTRRSSDLTPRRLAADLDRRVQHRLFAAVVVDTDVGLTAELLGLEELLERARDRRSEEHTSELQSHVNLVCRLLLEKKNTDSTHGRSPVLA